ncbi:MAG: hypothetical protein U0359_21005 [Byssovorax sp.]
MRRDSLYGEPVLWSGRPASISTPPVYRIAAAVCAVTSAISTSSSVVVATALHTRPSSLLAFAAWMATLALLFAYGPRWWRSELEYVLTDRHIIMRRGKLRRSIDRREISYARIHWDPKSPGTGDLELVRAVPTGALRRRLAIVLSGLTAPDRVWAIIRGVTPAAPAGRGHRLLAQRLDEGERVLWSAHPKDGWRVWLPSGPRAWASCALALGVAVAAATTGVHAVHALRAVVAGGLAPESASFVALLASLSLMIVLLVSTAVGLLYAAIVRPARLSRRTRYLITDRRVLIQRGDDELHLDRSRIAFVIETRAERGLSDVFLVLDGPRARAVAANGAFGEARGPGLEPVLRRVTDVDAVQQILRHPAAEPLPHAA